MNKPWKAVTIYDIALKIGKSPSTVSRAFSDHPMIKEETKILVRKIAKELGFEPDNRTGQNTTYGAQAIGVIIPFLNRDGMSEMVTAILDNVTQAGYDVIISQSMGSEKKEAELLRNMFARKVKGLLICLLSEKKEPYQFAKYQQFNIPVCSFFKTLAYSYGSKIYVDEHIASYQLTEHLIASGCSKIGYVTGAVHTPLFNNRVNGYVAALKNHQINFNKALIFRTTPDSIGGEQIAKQILQSAYAVDALIFSDDACAIGCMNALKQLAKVIPDDIAIACFNATGTALLAHPPITSIDYPYQQIGRLAANQLIKELQSKQTQKNQTVSLQVEHHLSTKRSSQKRAQVAHNTSLKKFNKSIT